MQCQHAKTGCKSTLSRKLQKRKTVKRINKKPPMQTRKDLISKKKNNNTLTRQRKKNPYRPQKKKKRARSAPKNCTNSEQPTGFQSMKKNSKDRQKGRAGKRKILETSGLNFKKVHGQHNSQAGRRKVRVQGRRKTNDQGALLPTNRNSTTSDDAKEKAGTAIDGKKKKNRKRARPLRQPPSIPTRSRSIEGPNLKKKERSCHSTSVKKETGDIWTEGPLSSPRGKFESQIEKKIGHRSQKKESREKRNCPNQREEQTRKEVGRRGARSPN